MNSGKTVWLSTKHAGIPCAACGKVGTCTVSPDGSAFKCWRNGGRVHQSEKAHSEARTTHVGNAPRIQSKAAIDPMTFATAEAAIAEAQRGISGAVRSGQWSYRDPAENELMRVVRFDMAGGAKQFRPVHRNGTWWRIGDPPGKLPLYGLGDLPTQGIIWVTEGEKAAEAARGLGLPAVTSAHGASAAGKTDWSPLAGRDVVVLPDNDEPGRKYAADVIRLLHGLDRPARVKVIELPGLPDGGDIVEYVEAHEAETVDALRGRVQALADAASVAGPIMSSGEPWPDPAPLPVGLPQVTAFDFALLPKSLRAWVRDIADRMQCPPDYCAATAIIAAGALIGRKVAIRPKRHDDWAVVPNLYGMMVGRPSLMKSPAMKEVLKPIVALEVAAKNEHAAAEAAHEATAMVATAARKVRASELKNVVAAELKNAAVTGGEGEARSLAESIVREREADAPPSRRRYMVGDSTVEKLGEILAENENGVLMFLDELVGLLRSMEREGHEADRAFYLTAWAGDARFSYDRIGRGTLDIEAAVVSIAGSIQPGVLADYMRAATQGGAGDDGLVQRFQVSVYPDAPPTWANVDRYPDSLAKNQAYEAIVRLDRLTRDDVGAERDEIDTAALPYLRFAPDGQEQFNAWWEAHERRLRTGAEHPAIESHLAKFRSLVPSLALILHLLDGGAGPIGAGAVEQAVAWAKYLESHARRIYACVTEAPAVAARALAMRLKAGDIVTPFAARDVYRNGWSGLDKERTGAAIDVLLSLWWLEERLEPTGGRERTRYLVNPKITNAPPGVLTELTKAPSVSFVSTLPRPECESTSASPAPSGNVRGGEQSIDTAERTLLNTRVC